MIWEVVVLNSPPMLLTSLKKELKKSAKYVSNASKFILHYYMYLFIVILCSEVFLFKPLPHEVICKLIMSLYSNSICKCQ